MHPDAAALDAIGSTLEGLIERIAGIGDRHRNASDDPVTPALDEVERALRAAEGRLAQLQRDLRRSR